MSSSADRVMRTLQAAAALEGGDEGFEGSMRFRLPLLDRLQVVRVLGKRPANCIVTSSEMVWSVSADFSRSARWSRESR